MARPRERVPGNAYFTVSYHDTGLLMPFVHTLVYRGRDAYVEDGRRAWSFEEPEGMAADVDYRADKGRTRVLELTPRLAPIDDIVAPCGRVLTGVHAMRADDALTFHLIGADRASSKEP